ncbi:MAG: flavin reductase family protein [Planctomycetes bacterium]|nr:flavin reductase family protein [Planctomycetota bacterium]
MPDVLLPSELSPSRNYFLLTSLLVPRPIAWVSTRSQEGVVNVAPFSFYGGISGNPPIFGLGIARRADGRRKDTAQNAIDLSEFVVHLAEEPLLSEMVGCSAELEPDQSEAEALGLELVDSHVISVPSLAATRVRLECRLHQHQEVGYGPVDFLMGEVVAFVLADGLLDERGRVEEESLEPLSRLGGAWYAPVRERFKS